MTESRAKAKGYRKVSSSKGEFLIQGPGARNALGRVKFLLEKTNAIYLHDTDKPWAFDKAERALSHGCMRVHKALDLAKYVATTRAGLDDDRFSRILDSGNTRVLELEQPITVYTDYNTVGLSDAGEVIFYEDIYGYDKAFWRGKLPPRGWTRFGSPAMKPRKVPRIPFKQYLRLKREGGAAPMKWPPEDHTRG